jgi:hypothetical protein
LSSTALALGSRARDSRMTRRRSSSDRASGENSFSLRMRRNVRAVCNATVGAVGRSPSRRARATRL